MDDILDEVNVINEQDSEKKNGGNTSIIRWSHPTHVEQAHH